MTEIGPGGLGVSVTFCQLSYERFLLSPTKGLYLYKEIFYYGMFDL